tara:strand:+ start:586 stop:756 length:171 start_codon:yes stop_codon:yes gene_type:complete
MKDIYRDHTAKDPITIHVLAWTASMQASEDIIQAHADTIKDAGHIAESTQLAFCSD